METTSTAARRSRARQRPRVVAVRDLVRALGVGVGHADEFHVGEFGVDPRVVLAHAPDADDAGPRDRHAAHASTPAAATAATMSSISDDERAGWTGSDSTSSAARSATGASRSTSS